MNDYERNLDEFGRRLVQVAEREEGQRAASWWRVLSRWPGALSAGALAAAVAVALVLTLGPGGEGQRLNFLAQAQAALRPDGKIFHLKLSIGEIHGGRRVMQPYEIWSATDPPRWRVVHHESRPRCHNGKGRSFINTYARDYGRVENAYAAETMRYYRAVRDVMYVVRGITDDPHLFTPLGLDPLGDLRQRLADGELRDAGTIMRPSGPARKLVSRERSGPMTRVWTYLIDEERLQPVGGSFAIEFAGGNPPRSISRFQVEQYETLPDVAENHHLLDIKTTPTTRRINRPAEPSPAQRRRWLQSLERGVRRAYLQCKKLRAEQ